MLRLVLDTNVLVSAITHNGKPRKLFRMGIDGKYQIIISREILDELPGGYHKTKIPNDKG